jgi:hypothetical protein
MKKALLFLFLLSLAFGYMYASEETKPTPPTNVSMEFPYVSLGLGPAPIPLPVFGAGYRLQRGYHGFDASVDIATIYQVTGLKGTFLYNYYFKPNPKSQFYFGVGPAIGAIFDLDDRHPELAGALGFSFGKQYQNDTGDTRFFEADIDFPVVADHHVYAFPIVILKYGIGF